MSLEIIPINIGREIDGEDNIPELIKKSKTSIADGDVLVISQKAISKQEGRLVQLSNVIPSLLAVGISSEYEKDPKLVELILSESKRIVRMENGIIIVETHSGLVCANAGVDESNVSDGFAALLPINPDKSALQIKNEIQNKIGKNIAVIISDTFGRPFRMGQTDCAIGISGMDGILDYRGKTDTFGKNLRVTTIAIADEICSAAELVMGKTTMCPMAIIRNYKFSTQNGSIKSLLRPKEEDLFR